MNLLRCFATLVILGITLSAPSGSHVNGAPARRVFMLNLTLKRLVSVKVVDDENVTFMRHDLFSLSDLRIMRLIPLVNSDTNGSGSRSENRA